MRSLTSPQTMTVPPRFAALRAGAPLLLVLCAGCGAAPAPPPRPMSDATAAPRREEQPFLRVGTVERVGGPEVGAGAPPPEADPEGPSDPPREHYKAQDEAARLPAGTAAATAPPPDEQKAREAESSTRGGVRGAVVDSTGSLSETEVRETIVQKQAVFKSCYDMGAASAPGGFAGTVQLRASIGPTGTVASVEVVGSTTKNVKVDLCVADVVRRIQFPARGGSAVVGFPIEFGR